MAVVASFALMPATGEVGIALSSAIFVDWVLSPFRLDDQVMEALRARPPTAKGDTDVRVADARDDADARVAAVEKLAEEVESTLREKVKAFNEYVNRREAAIRQLSTMLEAETLVVAVAYADREEGVLVEQIYY